MAEFKVIENWRKCKRKIVSGGTVFLKKLLTCNLKWHKYSLVRQIASSSNGRTADSDSVNLGSNPGEAANKKTPRCGRFFYWLKSIC